MKKCLSWQKGIILAAESALKAAEIPYSVSYNTEVWALKVPGTTCSMHIDTNEEHHNESDMMIALKYTSSKGAHGSLSSFSCVDTFVSDAEDALGVHVPYLQVGKVLSKCECIFNATITALEVAEVAYTTSFNGDVWVINVPRTNSSIRFNRKAVYSDTWMKVPIECFDANGQSSFDSFSCIDRFVKANS